VNAIHKEKIKELKCLPDQRKEMGDTVMKRMEEMDCGSMKTLLCLNIVEG
jgi:hypothetical protein